MTLLKSPWLQGLVLFAVCGAAYLNREHLNPMDKVVCLVVAAILTVYLVGGISEQRGD